MVSWALLLGTIVVKPETPAEEGKMPTNDDYLRLRRMTGEVDSDTYPDAELEIFLSNADGDLFLAASRIWGEKASAYADLVDISEAGSQRKNSDLFKHAKEQQAYFAGLAPKDPEITATDYSTQWSTTRPIVRP